jgi:PAS domain S-box-containing protein
MKILVVDDNQVTLYLLEALLHGHGHEVVTASNGVEALERVQQGGIDLIISDILMPQMDGFQLCRKIKGDEQLKRIPFIFHTAAHTDPRDEAFAMSLGAARYIAKPTEPQVFINILQEVINEYAAGPFTAPELKAEEETAFLKEYSERLVKKLEDKMIELEKLNEQLRESEAKYRELIENANDAVMVIQPSGSLSFVNPKFCEMTGHSRKDAIQLHFNQLLHGGDLAKFAEQVQRMLSRELTSAESSFRLVTRAGQTIDVDSHASLLLHQGRAIGIQAILRDITERKRAEEALRASEDRYRDLFENANDLIFTHDLQGNFTSINKAAEQVTGYTREEALRMNFSQIVAPSHLELAWRMIGTQAYHGQPAIYELEIMAKNGQRVWLDVNARPIMQEGRIIGVQGIAREVTERKHLEEQLWQSQKMEAVGQLAGGVAHDFNNLLTAINGYSELLLRRIGPEDAIRKELQEILKAGQRATSLTRQLLAFSRRQVLQPKVIDLNTAVSEMGKMLRRLIGEDIELLSFTAPDLGPVKVDPGQIEQVILNLAVNARDAMPKGGKLIIETTNVKLDEIYARQHIAVTPGDYVCLAISDTGCGMDAETQSRLFEPFFTTKEPGKGTGLGLSTVYGIVKQSGGNIWVYSEPGRGTTFKIYLPRVNEPVERVRPAEETAGHLQGSEVILLVEDDGMVRSLVSEILRMQGYQVLEASSGHEAIYLCEHRQAPIHLLLTDMVLPGLSGSELAERLSGLRPGLKVLFMSGYTDRALLHQGHLNFDEAYLQKPFTPDALARKVREVLDAARVTNHTI